MSIELKEDTYCRPPQAGPLGKASPCGRAGGIGRRKTTPQGSRKLSNVNIFQLPLPAQPKRHPIGCRLVVARFRIC